MTGKTAKILIVDDEIFITQVLQRALDKEGYFSQAAEDAQQALTLLAASPFDLILCDLELPGMSGIEFFRKLVDLQPSMGDRFLFMTGEMLDPNVEDFMSAQHIPLLRKPFDLQEFLLMVRNSLGAA